MAEVRTKYDVENDLGGLALAKVWGVASCKSLVAACFTLHPGDMVEYIQTAEERATVVFSYTDENRNDDLLPSSALTEKDLGELAPPIAQQNIVEWALGWKEEQGALDDAMSRQIVDAVGCLQREGSSSAFETCEICGEGVEWIDFKEARCTNGHEFLRCALTFLAIQEPGISKYCSSCGRQYLDGEKLPFASTETITNGLTEPPSVNGRHGEVFELARPNGEAREHKECEPFPKTHLALACQIFEHFDTCVYCGGKYRG